MKEKESVPFAPALIESMRSIGYSFETAIADLIDNSISAASAKIDINLYSDVEPTIIVIDDGYGMSKIELEEAMRYGSTNPLESRCDSDLGRFGLGMKSASLSQCRKLTVISKKQDQISCFSWDLDHIIEKGKWALLEFDESEIVENQFSRLLHEYTSGTLLILEKFDRVKKTTGNIYKTINDMLINTIDHLALVFHRYLDEGLIIRINNNPIVARDPFLSRHKSTSKRRTQTFYIDEQAITVKPYILPHVSKLKHDDVLTVGGKDNMRSEQGFYIYRNKRLIIWGTWFNLERKLELNKLARVRVDIPNSLDYVWSIDIKKSSAKLPDIIKTNLHNAVYETIQASEKVHMFRGRKTCYSENIQHIWERIKTRTGYTYRINRELPELKVLSHQLNQQDYESFEKFLKVLEDTVPASNLYIDVAKDVYDNKYSVDTQENFNYILDKLNKAIEVELDPVSILEAYLCTEPYCSDVGLQSLIRKEISKYE